MGITSKCKKHIQIKSAMDPRFNRVTSKILLALVIPAKAGIHGAAHTKVKGLELFHKRTKPKKPKAIASVIPAKAGIHGAVHTKVKGLELFHKRTKPKKPKAIASVIPAKAGIHGAVHTKVKSLELGKRF